MESPMIATLMGAAARSRGVRRMKMRKRMRMMFEDFGENDDSKRRRGFRCSEELLKTPFWLSLLTMDHGSGFKIMPIIRSMGRLAF